MDAIRPYLPYAHVVGAIVVTLLLVAAEMAVFYLLNKHHFDEYLEPNLALNVGLTPTELHTDEGKEKIARYLLDRYNSDQFKNRLSDLASVPLAVWGIVWMVIEVAFVVWVGWRIYTGDTDPAFMWLLPFLWLFAAVVQWIFIGCCWLITGRMPAQAKTKRDQAAKLLKEIGSRAAT